MYSIKHLSILAISLFLVGRVSSNALWRRTLKDYGQCPFTNAVEEGRIKDPELKETSGLVQSHKNYGVFYAIQDSLNPDPVYAINKEGDLLGECCKRFTILENFLQSYNQSNFKSFHNSYQ